MFAPFPPEPEALYKVVSAFTIKFFAVFTQALQVQVLRLPIDVGVLI